MNVSEIEAIFTEFIRQLTKIHSQMSTFVLYFICSWRYNQKHLTEMMQENQEFEKTDPLNEAFIQQEQASPGNQAPKISSQNRQQRVQDYQVGCPPMLENILASTMIQQIKEQMTPLKRRRPSISRQEQQQGEVELQLVLPRWSKRKNQKYPNTYFPSYQTTIQTLLQLIQNSESA